MASYSIKYKKRKIDLDIILPDVPDEKDACVQRIINEMEGRQGIEEVHVVPENEKAKVQLGMLAVMDIPRKEAKETIVRLNQIGIKRMVMLTGDNQKVAEAIAKEVDITDAWGSLLPEHKVDAIKKLVAGRNL